MRFRRLTVACGLCALTLGCADAPNTTTAMRNTAPVAKPTKDKNQHGNVNGVIAYGTYSSWSKDKNFYMSILQEDVDNSLADDDGKLPVSVDEAFTLAGRCAQEVLQTDASALARKSATLKYVNGRSCFWVIEFRPDVNENYSSIAIGVLMSGDVVPPEPTSRRPQIFELE